MRRALPAALLLLALAAPAGAAEPPEIIAAKRAGQVGERFDGYLGIAAPVGEAVRRQVRTINITRRSLYTDLAERRGVQPSEVAITAGCATLATVEVGDVYWLGARWDRRGQGQPAPRPAYCD